MKENFHEFMKQSLNIPLLLSPLTAILKNLCYWLGLQTLAQDIPISAEALPLSDIVITASCRGPQDLLFAVPFVAQIFVAASCSMTFQPSLPYFRELLSLLARLHAYPHVGLHCILEIKILFNHLSLQLSHFQSSSEQWNNTMVTSVTPIDANETY